MPIISKAQLAKMSRIIASRVQDNYLDTDLRKGRTASETMVDSIVQDIVHDMCEELKRDAWRTIGIDMRFGDVTVKDSSYLANALRPTLTTKAAEAAQEIFKNMSWTLTEKERRTLQKNIRDRYVNSVFDSVNDIVASRVDGMAREEIEKHFGTDFFAKNEDDDGEADENNEDEE